MSSDREQFKTRLGFLLIAAGCAIGLGNVWRFPYITGMYGGALFVIIYLAFLLCVGMPLLTIELAIGRASRRSIARAYEVLEKPKSKWHLNKIWQSPGSYILMSFYGVITGWLFYYMIRFFVGGFEAGIQQEQASVEFSELLAHPLTMFVCMTTVVVASFAIVALGVVRGVERITKPMMLLLFALLIFMALRSFTLPGFSEGISYYLMPNADNISKYGIMEVLWAAMGQSFFTLSVGQGSILIFGSYMDKQHTLVTEATCICGLDTTVALLSGFIIFPACFSYGIAPDAGPNLLFVTLTTVFSNMSLGWFWGGLFFLFMLFAAVSTLIAVFESIIAISMDLFAVSRVKAVIINFLIITVMAIPCVLGFNYLSFVHPLGFGTILDFQDFLISNNVLPIGSLIFVLFITAKNGWGFDNYLKECNIGNGIKLSRGLIWYFRFIMPIIIAVLLVAGYVNIFA